MISHFKIDNLGLLVCTLGKVIIAHSIATPTATTHHRHRHSVRPHYCCHEPLHHGLLLQPLLHPSAVPFVIVVCPTLPWPTATPVLTATPALHCRQPAALGSASPPPPRPACRPTHHHNHAHLSTQLYIYIYICNRYFLKFSHGFVMEFYREKLLLRYFV